jgi:hypothetical protein
MFHVRSLSLPIIIEEPVTGPVHHSAAFPHLPSIITGRCQLRAAGVMQFRTQASPESRLLDRLDCFRKAISDRRIHGFSTCCLPTTCPVVNSWKAGLIPIFGCRYCWLRSPGASCPVCTDDLFTLRRAALQGIGAVLIPHLAVANDLEGGTLVRLLPSLKAHVGVMHAVFPSRRGMIPAVRALLDLLAETVRRLPS